MLIVWWYPNINALTSKFQKIHKDVQIENKWLILLTFLCRCRRRSPESLLRQPVLVVTVRNNQSCWVCIHAAEGTEEQENIQANFLPVG